MINPYKDTDWGSVTRTPSTNHWHQDASSSGVPEQGDTVFWAMYYSGLKHIAISAYYPSRPAYPIDNNWWFSLPESEQPSDTISSPNTEGHSLKTSMHFGTIGSFWENTLSQEQWLEVDKSDYLDYPEVFSDVINQLQYPDGGGVIINHPLRAFGSGSPTVIRDKILQLLEFDEEHVLGIEAFNYRSEEPRYNFRGNALHIWDEVLMTGTRCWGFFVSDRHGAGVPKGSEIDIRYTGEYYSGLGRNILLLNTPTEHEALRAYRNGNFYGAMWGDRIIFTRIEAVGNDFIVETDAAEKIVFHSASEINGVVSMNPEVTVIGSSATYTVDETTIFVRAVAYEVDGETDPFLLPITTEKIFTQAWVVRKPIIRPEKKENKARKLLLLKSQK